MPVTEQDALMALQAAKLFSNEPEKVAKAKSIHDAYKQQQEAAGKPLFENHYLAKANEAERVRKFFTDRETHGLDETLLRDVSSTFQDPEKKARFFNNQFLARTFNRPTEEIRKLGTQYRDEYAKANWGAPVKTESEFYQKLGEEFDLEDQIDLQAQTSAMRGLPSVMGWLDPNAGEQDPKQAAQIQERHKKRFEETARATAARLSPYRQTVTQTVEDLRSTMGVDGAEGEAGSFSDFAQRLVEIPESDRNFVISAIIANAGEGEAKGVAQKLAENFARGARDIAADIPAFLDRTQLGTLSNLVNRGIEIEGDASTVEGYLAGVNARLGVASDPTGAAGIQNLIEGKGEMSKPSPEVIEAAKERIEKAFDVIDLNADLRRIADENIDPAKGEYMVTRGLYAAARSIPYTFVAMTPGGVALNTVALAEQSYQTVRQANPDMSRGEAMAISAVAGPIMAGLEKIPATMLTGKLPTLGRFLNQAVATRGGAAARFGIRLAEGTGVEMLQENVQDLTPYAVQGSIAALSEDMPDVPWGQIYGGDFWQQQGELFFATLPLALIGAGAGTVRDFSAARETLHNREAITALIGNQAKADEIREAADAGNYDKAQTLLREGMREAKTDSKPFAEARAEAAQSLQAQVAAQAETIQKAEASGILPVIGKTAEGWTLRFEDGNAREFKTHTEADAARWAYAQEKAITELDEFRGAIQAVERQIEAGREVVFSFSPERRTLRDAVQEGEVSRQGALNRAGIAEEIGGQQAQVEPEAEIDPEQEYQDTFTASELQALAEDDKLALFEILGSNKTEFADGVQRTTVKLFRGATPLTVIEEKLEGDAALMLGNGKRDWLLTRLRRYERASGDKMLPRLDSEVTDGHLKEAFSHLGQSYLVGRSRKSERQDLGFLGASGRKKAAKVFRSGLGSTMEGYRNFFRSVWKRAAKLNKLRREGRLDTELEQELARSVGFGEQAQYEASVQTEAEGFKAALEDMGFEAEPEGVTIAEATDDAPFSVIATSQDSAYLSAVERGDMETAQRMVDEAARAAGYWLKAFHQTNNDFKVFDMSKVGTGSGGRNTVWGKPSAFFTIDGPRIRGLIKKLNLKPAYGAKEISVYLKPDTEKDYVPHTDLAAVKAGLDDSGKEIAITDANRIKSADPITYDESGNIIPLSQRFNPARDEINYSVITNADARIAEMFTPLYRNPEQRRKIVQLAKERVAIEAQKFAAIARANRPNTDIERERKEIEGALFNEKLDTLSSGEIQALSNGNLLEDNSLQPILSELLNEKTRTAKSGKKVRYWTGSLMSKSEAKRRGYSMGGEWDAVPEGLPPYVWGGSITPDQAATMFGFDSPEAFFDALAGEIQSRSDRKREIEEANRRVRELEKEARTESRAWAEEQRKLRQTVGTDRKTLIAAIRTLDAMISSLPVEVRGKMSGFSKLATLVGPSAMVDYFENRVAALDRVLEKWLKDEATREAKEFFEDVKKKKKVKAGEKASAKALPEMIKAMDAVENAFKSMSADEGAARGAEITGLIQSGKLPDDDIAAAQIMAELIPLFSGWNGRTEEQIIKGKATRVRVAEPSSTEQKFAAVEAAKKYWTEGLHEYKRQQAEIKERRDAMRSEGEADIAKANTLRTRDEQKIFEQGRSSLPKKFALNIMSFDGFFRWHFGDDSSIYKWVTDSERKAANAYDDAVRNISKSVDDWMTARVGSRFRGEKLRERLATSTTEITPEVGEVRTMSQLEMITAKLIWRQDDGKRHMKGRRDEKGNVVSTWSYGEGFMAQIDEALSEDALALMEFLSDAYDKEYAPLNKVYRKLFGIDLPKHILYSPLTVKPMIKGDAGVDPVTGFFSGGLSGIAGALKTRGTSIVEPDFKDALQVYVSHSMQMEHFKAFAEFSREARAIFGRVEFQDQVKRASGDEGVSVLNGLLEILDKGGIRSSHVYLETGRTLEKLTGRLSTMILFGKLQTVALNMTQLAAASSEMGVKTYWRQLGKLAAGRLDWIKALKTEYIQRRIDEMPPVIRQAIESNRKLGPSRLADVNDKLGYGIAATDGFFTAGTYVMVYDWKQEQGRKMGLKGEGLEAWARNETERIVDRLAQPTRKGARSIFENTMSSEGRAFFNFISEPRKNLALISYAFQKDRSKIAGVAQFILLNALVSSVIRAAWQDARDDDEEEDSAIWNPRKMLLEIALDPAYGIPVVGGVIQDAIKAAFGFKTFGGTILESGQNAIPAARRAVSADYNADEIDQIAADLNAILGAFGYFSRDAAALTSITNVIEDALKVYDNLTQ